MKWDSKFSLVLMSYGVWSNIAHLHEGRIFNDGNLTANEKIFNEKVFDSNQRNDSNPDVSRDNRQWCVLSSVKSCRSEMDTNVWESIGICGPNFWRNWFWYDRRETENRFSTSRISRLSDCSLVSEIVILDCTDEILVVQGSHLKLTQVFCTRWLQFGSGTYIPSRVSSFWWVSDVRGSVK